MERPWLQKIDLSNRAHVAYVLKMYYWSMCHEFAKRVDRPLTDSSLLTWPQIFKYSAQDTTRYHPMLPAGFDTGVWAPRPLVELGLGQFASPVATFRGGQDALDFRIPIGHWGFELAAAIHLAVQWMVRDFCSVDLADLSKRAQLCLPEEISRVLPEVLHYHALEDHRAMTVGFQTTGEALAQFTLYRSKLTRAGTIISEICRSDMLRELASLMPFNAFGPMSRGGWGWPADVREQKTRRDIRLRQDFIDHLKAQKIASLAQIREERQWEEVGEEWRPFGWGCLAAHLFRTDATVPGVNMSSGIGIIARRLDERTRVLLPRITELQSRRIEKANQSLDFLGA